MWFSVTKLAYMSEGVFVVRVRGHESEGNRNPAKMPLLANPPVRDTFSGRAGEGETMQLRGTKKW